MPRLLQGWVAPRESSGGQDLSRQCAPQPEVCSGSLCDRLHTLSHRWLVGQQVPHLHPQVLCSPSQEAQRDGRTWSGGRCFTVTDAWSRFFPLFRKKKENHKISSAVPGAFPREFRFQRDRSADPPSVGCAFQIVNSEPGKDIHSESVREASSLRSSVAANDMPELSEAVGRARASQLKRKMWPRRGLPRWLCAQFPPQHKRRAMDLHHEKQLIWAGSLR